MRSRRLILASVAALPAVAALAVPADATANDGQTPVDRADPAIVIEQDERPDGPARRGEAPAVEAVPDGVAALSGAPIVVGAILIDGSEALSPADFAAAIEPYLGRSLGPAELRALLRDVAAVARRAGFGLATAWIPPQRIERGLLRIRIDEGRIDEIAAEGPAAAAVERRLRPLTGTTLRLAELERRLLIAGDLPGVSLGRPRLVRRGGRNVLVVPTRRDRVRGRASIDNSGSDTIGPVRARLSVDVNGLLGDDRLTVGGATTPLQPREYRSAQGEYSVAIGGNGLEVAVAGAIGETNAGGSLRDRDLDGRSSEVTVRATYPLLRSREASLWASAGGTIRNSELDREGAPNRDDRIVTANASLYANGRLAGGRARVRLSYFLGLAWFHATEIGDPLASRRDAGGSFSKIDFWLRYTRPLGSGFSIDLSGEAQLASRPLLASEEMGLGGRRFLRGFDYREMAGDQGAAFAAELRYEPRIGGDAIDRLQLYAFGDVGRVVNLRGGFGGGTLASAGAGARLWFLDRFEGGFELALPLTEGLFDEDPDPRLSVSLGSRF